MIYSNSILSSLSDNPMDYLKNSIITYQKKIKIYKIYLIKNKHILTYFPLIQKPLMFTHLNYIVNPIHIFTF